MMAKLNRLDFQVPHVTGLQLLQFAEKDIEVKNQMKWVENR